MKENNSKDRPSNGCKGCGRLVLVHIPDYVNPRPLIDLALNMVCPDDGQVVALHLRTGEPEVDALKRHQIEPLIESYQNDGKPVELTVHSSSSVTRGIRVRRPSTSAARPARKIPPSVTRPNAIPAACKAAE